MRRVVAVVALALLAACVSPTSLETAAPSAGATESTEARGAPAATLLPAVRVDPNRALGSPAATIAVVEFGDYQCPYCRGFHVGTLPKLDAAYVQTGKVRYFYKDFPLPMHKSAVPASVVAYCAGAQDRYWQMHDLLYAEQARLGESLYKELAEELKLDMTRFEACRHSRRAQVAVYRNLNDGRALGVSGTPSFVLGRVEGDHVVVQRMATGAPAFEVFARELDALLR